MNPIVVSMLLALVSPVSMTQSVASAGVRSPEPAVPVTLGQLVVALTGPWKFQIGDDPRWADPNFDDSGWEPYDLAPGDRLTFVSDGVVEARNPKGELLGFERAAALTGKQAAEIADAAQRWGQEDDITVLTVARVPALEAVTA